MDRNIKKIHIISGILLTLGVILVFMVTICPELDFMVGGCNSKNITITDKYTNSWYFVADSDNNVYILRSSFSDSHMRISERYKNYKINCTYQVTVCAFDTIVEEKENGNW